MAQRETNTGESDGPHRRWLSKALPVSAGLCLFVAFYVLSAAIVSRVELPPPPPGHFRFPGTGKALEATIYAEGCVGSNIFYDYEVEPRMHWKPLDILYRPIISQAKLDPETGTANLVARILGIEGK